MASGTVGSSLRLARGTRAPYTLGFASFYIDFPPLLWPPAQMSGLSAAAQMNQSCFHNSLAKSTEPAWSDRPGLSSGGGGGPRMPRLGAGEGELLGPVLAGKKE